MTVLNSNPDTATAADDHALMKQYANGSSAAFDDLYARYKQPLYNFLVYRCSDAQLADEVFQDTWLAIISARNQYQPTGTFKAWIYRIARNKLIDQHRKRPKSRHDPFDEQQPPDTESTVSMISSPLTPLEVNELKDDRATIDKALQALPVEQREAMLLKHIGGLTTAEIADELNLSLIHI